MNTSRITLFKPTRGALMYNGGGSGSALLPRLGGVLPPRAMNLGLLIAIVIMSNFVSQRLFHGIFSAEDLPPSPPPTTQVLTVSEHKEKKSLYLMDLANRYVKEGELFEKKVKEIAYMLKVEPEWLMAVMYAESKFNAAIKNHRGSGAVGLIQFMPTTAKELNISMERLKRMSAVSQLEYVYLYLQRVRDRYGDFRSLTDLYLAILYPRAVSQDPCYVLYAKPSRKYKMNSGLDENKDGFVTVSDIDRRMQRIYPTAYVAGKKDLAS